MTLLHTFSADDLAAEVYLSASTGRFHVVLRDTDADLTLPVVNIYNSEAVAVAYAKTLVA